MIMCCLCGKSMSGSEDARVEIPKWRCDSCVVVAEIVDRKIREDRLDVSDIGSRNETLF